MFKLNNSWSVVMLCNQLKALSKESSLLKMKIILIEISNMWTARLLQCWVSTFKFKISW